MAGTIQPCVELSSWGPCRTCVSGAPPTMSIAVGAVSTVLSTLSQIFVLEVLEIRRKGDLDMSHRPGGDVAALASPSSGVLFTSFVLIVPICNISVPVPFSRTVAGSTEGRDWWPCAGPTFPQPWSACPCSGRRFLLAPIRNLSSHKSYRFLARAGASPDMSILLIAVPEKGDM